MFMNQSTQLKEVAYNFSPSAIKRLINDGLDSLGHSLTSYEKHGISVSKWYEFAYEKLVCDYRNEYVYKNAIAEKIIRGRHRFSTKCFYASEFRVRGSIADVVIANGTTTAYEIKTEYDSFERLHGQLSDYTKVFEHVYVVMPEKKLSAWEDKVPREIGIIILTDNYTLKECREPKSNLDNFDLETIFSAFRRSEFIVAIQNQFGFVPECRPVELKSKCRELFLLLSKEQAHEEFKNALKSRRFREEQIELLKAAPSALTSALLSIELTRKEVSSLDELLQEVI